MKSLVFRSMNNNIFFSFIKYTRDYNKQLFKKKNRERKKTLE